MPSSRLYPAGCYQPWLAHYISGRCDGTEDEPLHLAPPRGRPLCRGSRQRFREYAWSLDHEHRVCGACLREADRLAKQRPQSMLDSGGAP